MNTVCRSSSSFLALVLACLALSAAAQDGGKPVLRPSVSEAAAGEVFTVTVENVPAGEEVLWSESSATIRVVQRRGTVSTYRARAAGEAVICATVGETALEARVRIVAAAGTGPAKPNPPHPPGSPPQDAAASPPPSTGGQSDAQTAAIIRLLDRARTSLGGMEAQYGPGGNEGAAVKPSDPERLVRATEEFFAGMRAEGLTMRHLQAFKERAKAAGALPTDSVLFPGRESWGQRYQGVERALMAGRTEMVEAAWRQTLNDFFVRHPDGAVFGRIDIGSWVKNTLGDLGFEADIDFSSVSLDPKLNLEIKQLFESHLRSRAAGMSMVDVDAILTAHGQATPDVFIGDWGRTFAELDMLKRSRWSVLRRVERDGKVTIEAQPKSGAALFWEVAIRRSQTGTLGDDEMFPKMTLDMEPMLSLEMLRHGIHDIEHGPFERGQKIIKILKYVERSYFMNRKAVAGNNWNPYDEVDPKLASIADRLIALKGQKHKMDPATGKPVEMTLDDKIPIYEDLITDLAEEALSENNIDRVVDRVVARCKTAMIDNATKSLAFRLVGIARIEDEVTRQASVDKLWDNLNDEIAAFQESGVPVPDLLLQARELANQVRRGQLSYEEMEQRGQELHRLLEDAYKMPPPLIERILPFDLGIKIAAALKRFNKMTDDQISDFIGKARAKKTHLGNLLVGIHEMNGQMDKVTNGSKVMSALDTADTVLSLYEGWTGGRTKYEKAKNVSYILARVGVSSQNPLFGIPFGLYESAASGSLMPASMAVGFYFFPFAGQLAMVSAHLERLDVATKDRAFFNALQAAMPVTEFDTQGRITAFTLKNLLGEVIHEERLSTPGNRDEIVDIMENPERLIATSRQFQYWRDLTPRLSTEYGMSRNAVSAQQWVLRWTGRDIFGYTQKMDRLAKFFSSNEEFLGRLMLLKHHANLENFPQDEFTPEREQMLIRMEDELERAIWMAMADALESAVKSSTLKAEWEKELRQLEEELALRDLDVGRGQGLVSRVQAEIAAVSSIVTGENPYAAGLIYERYLKTYRTVLEVRRQIVGELWAAQFGIDVSAAQASPLRLVLMGGRIGAPSLTGDPDTDLGLARACLAAQMSRAQKTLEDLAEALDRPVDKEKDRERLKVLGQWSLEWEHLLDQCEGHLAANADPSTQSGLRERMKAYRDYLDNLRRPELDIAIAAAEQVLPGQPLTFEATVKRRDGKPLPELHYRWLVSTPEAHLEARDLAGKVSCLEPGPVTLSLEVTQRLGPDDERFVTSKVHRFEIVFPKATVDLEGPGQVPAEKEAAYLLRVECPEDVRPFLVARWHVDGIESEPARELERTFIARDAGKHSIGASLFAAIGGENIPLGGVRREILVTTSPGSPPGDGATTPGGSSEGGGASLDVAKLNLQLQITPQTAVIRVGEEAHLTASYSATPYVRERLKLVWDPEVGSGDHARVQGASPGTNPVTLRAFLTIDDVPREVDRTTATVTVLPPSTLEAPKEVLATEIFDVSVGIPGELREKVVRIEWSGGHALDAGFNNLAGKSTELTRLKMQFDPRPGGQMSVQAALLDAAGKAVDQSAARVVVKPAAFSARGSAVWEGGPCADGFSVRRKKAVRLRPEKTGTVESATAGGTFEVLWETTVPNDMASLKRIVEEAALWKSLPIGNASEGKIAVEPFGVADWKGFLKRTTQVVTRSNGSPDGYVDVAHPEARIAGYGMVMKGCCAFTIRYSAGGGGTALGEKKPWWDDMPFVTAHATAADAEIQALLGSLAIVADGAFTTTPYTGPALDGSDLPQPLQLTLNGPAHPLVPGRTAGVNAAVTGGKAPYSYTWTGDHAGSGASVTFVASKPGDYKLAVLVTDAAGQSANQEIVLKVIGAMATLGGLGQKIYYGETRKITVDLEALAKSFGDAKSTRPGLLPGYHYTPDGRVVNDEGREVDSGGRPKDLKADEQFIYSSDEEDIFTDEPAASAFKVIWQSSPNLTFDSPESSGATHVTFDRMPREGVKIWAQIVRDVDGVPTTVGETEQVTMQVHPPEFSVNFDPAAGKVGQEIRAAVTTTPVVPPALLNYEWSTPVSAERMEYNDPGSAIGFRLKSTAPYPVHARVLVPYDRDLIGEVQATYTGTGYQVKASVQETGVRVRVFDPVSKSFREPPRGAYVADERISLNSKVVGEPPPEEVRWQWSVNEGSVLSNPISQTPTVSRHETGSIVATVTARDRNDQVLGQDTLNLAVTIPAELANPLRVAVTADRPSLKSGEKTWVRATAQGGKTPYSYIWQPAAGSGSAVEVTAEKAGAQTVSVTVTDAKGAAISGAVELQVAAVPLRVRLTSDRPVYLVGEVARLVATVEGGREPYVFSWPPPATGAASQTIWPLERPGTGEIQVVVNDRFGNRGSGTLRLTAEPSQVTLEGLRTKEWRGAARPVRIVTVAPAPWEPVFLSEPAVDFAPAGPGNAVATFSNVGVSKLRVELRRGGQLLAQSPEYAVSVSEPRFAVVFEPATGRVGDAVLARLRSEPPEVRGAWAVSWEGAPGSAAGGDAFRFQPGDVRPVRLTATVRETSPGRVLGQAEGVFTAQPLELSLTGPGTPPLAGQPFEVRAALPRGVSLPALEVAWTAENGTVREGTGLTATLEAGKSGACNVAVRLRSPAGGEIGSGSLAVEVDAAGPANQAPGTMAGNAGNKAQAQDLVSEGFALEQSGDLPGAVGKYQAALALVPDSKLAAHVAELEELIARQTKAQQLVMEGYAHEQAGRLPEAVASYSEAHKLAPDPRLEAKINELTARISGGSNADFWTVDLTPVGGKKGPAALEKGVYMDRGSWVRLKEKVEERLQMVVPLSAGVPARAVSMATNLDNAHSVPQGTVVTRLTVVGDEGSQTFDIIAGVHSSEWNRSTTGGADHAFPQGADYDGEKIWLATFPLSRTLTVRALRFDYVKAEPKFWHWGPTGTPHGFVLRGLSLHRAGSLVTSGGPVPPPDQATAMPPGQVAPEEAPPVGNIGNADMVVNGPTEPATWEVTEPTLLIHLSTYHWNDGAGRTPGTIALQGPDGSRLGPWQASGTAGQGGVKNANWVTEPRVVLQPGVYTVIDSDPASWSTNPQSGNRGFFQARGIPWHGPEVPPGPLPPLPGGDPAAFCHVMDLSPYGGKKDRPSGMRGVLVDSSSYIRMKSTDEKRLRLDIPVPEVPATSLVLVACLDDSAYVTTGATLTRMTVTTSAGDRSFDLQAGIHASDWNYGESAAKNAFAKEAHVSRGLFFSRFPLPAGAKVSRIRFDYVDPQVELWYGHSPGFIIRGITLVKPGLLQP